VGDEKSRGATSHCRDDNKEKGPPLLRKKPTRAAQEKSVPKGKKPEQARSVYRNFN